jgi:integrase
MTFSIKYLNSLKPRASGQPYRVTDGEKDPGFLVQVSGKPDKPVLTFYQRYKWEEGRQFYNLGRYNGKNLAETRTRSGKIRSLVGRGKNPKLEDQRKIEKAVAAETARQEEKRRQEQAGTVNTLFEKYIENLEDQGKRSANQARRLWLANIAPVIGGLKAEEITPKDIRAVLYPMVKGKATPSTFTIPEKYILPKDEQTGRNKKRPRTRPALVAANRCRSYLMAAFRFGIEWENDPKNYNTKTVFNIASNPARDVPKPQKSEAPGERALTSTEIKTCWPLWGDPDVISLPVGVALRLLLATGGQRVEEVLRAAWVEFDTEQMLWVIPAGRTKSGRAHVVPLTALAVETLEKLRTYSGEGDLLFPSHGAATKPMQTNSLGNAARRFCKGAKCEKFTPRDLRRTVKTEMGRTGVSKDIRDRLQNHSLTDVSSKHYDRYDYLKEKRAVMKFWEGHLRAIIDGDPADSNVVKAQFGQQQKEASK